MRMLTRLFTLTVVLAATFACTWVGLQPEAEAVFLLNEADVANCQVLGTASGKTKDKWALLSRNDKKVATEVLNLARNEASYIGGNALVEKTALVNGRQTFTVYSCP